MNTSRLLLGTLLLCALSSSARPLIKPTNGLPYPMVSPAEAAQLASVESIKLHLRDRTIKEALKELERQTDMLIDTRAADYLGANKISLDLKTHSFKEAADAIFEKAGVKATLRKLPGDERWTIITGNVTQEKSKDLISGTEWFPIQLNPYWPLFNHDENAQTDNTTIPHLIPQMTAGFVFRASPELHVVDVPYFEVTRAEDDQGRSLLGPQQHQMSEGFRTYGFSNEMTLRVPEPNARLLTHLEGKAIYVLATKRKRWEVPELLNAKNVTHDFQCNGTKIQFIVESAQKTGDDLQLNINVKNPLPVHFPFPFPLEQYPLLQLNQNSPFLRVVNAQGRDLVTGRWFGSYENKQMKWDLTFSPPEEFLIPEAGESEPQLATPTLKGPLKLIVEVPTKLVQTEVPFSFSNLPLL